MIHLLLILVALGLIAWVLCSLPIPQPFRNIILAILCFVAVVYALQALGVSTGFGRIGL